MGAWLIIVYGETSTKPVGTGTNLATAQSSYVDILAHPGLITPEEPASAAQNNISVELTSRRGHSATNAHVARISQKAQARLLANSDAHNKDDLLTPALAETVLHQAALGEQ
jgi:putative hydrolase